MNSSYSYEDRGIPAELLTEKSIVTCVILTVLTCGIYSIFWSYSIIKSIRLLNRRPADIAGEFLCFILVPFYAFYWYYTRAEQLTRGAADYSIRIDNNGVLYLILAILGVPFVNLCLIQNDLNTVARVLNGQQPAAADSAAPAQEHTAAQVSGDISAETAAQLRRLWDLHQEGILTDEEFQRKKSDLLNRS